MKNHSHKTNKKVIRYRTPSVFKANKAQYTTLKYSHVKKPK